nr:hypothetical protein [Tanacetum cinerariifolium]
MMVGVIVDLEIHGLGLVIIVIGKKLVVVLVGVVETVPALVDAFIANKRSKGGKRFRFIRFLGIKDANEFFKTLSNIWIGNFHLYVAVVIFQRGNSFASQHVHRPHVKDTNPKTEPNPKNNSNPNFPYHQPHETKPSFADITLNKQIPSTPTLYKDTACSINLTENDLIIIEDSSTVLLLKLNEADTMRNMYSICKSEGFMDLSIHHVGGLSIWIQFSSPLSCFKFRESDSLKSIYSAIKAPLPLFRVDERMIWLEICGLPLCAWGSNSYKKIASLFVNRELFDVNVLEIGTWNINITDTANDVSSQMEANHLDKDDTSVEDKENDDLDDIDGILKDLDNDAKKEENIFVSPKEVVPDQPIKQVEEDILKQPEEECIKVSESSDLSRPPGFENTKKTISNQCSTNFARHHKKDIKGLIDLPIGWRHFIWMNKAGNKLSKLDHFLIFEGVMEDILDIKVTAIEQMALMISLSLHGILWKRTMVDVRKIDRSQKRTNLFQIHDIEKKIDDGSASISDQGDKNSKFFYGIINSNRRTQAITGILHDGDWITKPPLIKDVFLNYYKDKFQTYDSQVIFTLIANSPILCHHDQDFLESHISLDEVKNVVWECGSNKDPGPDDFHPISLAGTHYKIISKLLANRFSKVIDKIRACLHSSRASILINGSPTSKFSIKRELRQGDPLSPFLFILVMEGTGRAAGCFPFTYLGLSIGANMNLTSCWQILIGRFQKRISSCKANLLSIGGRLTYIKAVLGSLGIYYLSPFKAPETILNSMESLRSRFFWVGSQDSRNMAWVKWSQVLSSFKKGGLQIDSLKTFNFALLQKWHWRLLLSPNNMWLSIVKALHGQEGGLNNQGCSFNGTLSRIIGTSNFLYSKSIIPLNSFCFKVGCDTRVQFWIDIWICDSPLHIRYNRLYRLDQDKDCLIIDRIVNGQWQWNWSRSDIGTRNTAYLNDLLLEISQIDISVDEDTCTWVLLSNDGTFSVKTARHRLPHRLNLSSRGLDIPTISCSSCNGNVESADHVFFECDLVKEIWCLVRKWCDISIPTFDSSDTWNSWFFTCQATKVKNRRLYIIFAALFWWIWRYRNSVTFSSDSIKKGDLFDNIRASSFSWISNRGYVPCDWVEWLKKSFIDCGFVMVAYWSRKLLFSFWNTSYFVSC